MSEVTKEQVLAGFAEIEQQARADENSGHTISSGALLLAVHNARTYIAQLEKRNAELEQEAEAGAGSADIVSVLDAKLAEYEKRNAELVFSGDKLCKAALCAAGTFGYGDDYVTDAAKEWQALAAKGEQP